MNEQDDPRLREILDQASELPREHRGAFLEGACGRDQKLRGEIESLLASLDGAGGFLDEPTLDPVALSSRGDGMQKGYTGERIGRYKLLQRIGEGGFGTVWMAEQTEPVSRRVALKVIKLGMDTREVIARFEAERQALAMMDHPNIAKVFDAGATDTGRPYFVMELVKGIPITQYCDERQLSLKDRLALFGDVCSAINHAHQKGVIHRDIKPSNVMVTLHGDKPVVKVIDFGVAKATQGKLTDKTLFTRYEQFVGTPVYMSPEQATLSGLDIDTRSDIYALGILLYELLTGKPPFDSKSLVAAGYEEMRRIIREVEPPRPSTRLSTIAGDERSQVAKARRLSPEKLGRLVEADLDWIVMKAIDKDRSRRYETANGLAQDIERFLSDEPVSATPPSAAYQLRKFARRNKTAFRVAAAIAVVLVAATAVSSWQAVRATHAEEKTAAERDAKELARKDAESISTFLVEVFQSPDPARDGRTITVAELLDKAAKKLEADLSDQPQQRVHFQATLGRSYGTLGLPRQAIPLQERVLGFRRKTLGPDHPDTLAVMNDLATSYFDAGRRKEALKLRQEVLTLRQKVLGPDRPATLTAMNNLAYSYFGAGRLEEAIKLQEKVVKLSRKALGPEHADTLGWIGNLAVFYAAAGRSDQAMKMLEELLPLCRKVLGPEHPITLKAMGNLAISYAAAGHPVDALKLREEMLPLSRKAFGPEHSDTITATDNLAISYFGAGRPDEALKMQEEALSLSRRVLGTEHADTLSEMNNLAYMYALVGRRGEALKMQEQVLALRRKVNGPDHPATLTAIENLANSYFDAGRRDEALNMQEGVLTLRRKLLGPEHPDTLESLADISESYLAKAANQAWFGQEDELGVTCDKVLEVAKDAKVPEVADRASRACSLHKSDPRRHAAALALALRAVQLGQRSANLPQFQMALGMAEYRTGHYEKANAALLDAEQNGTDKPLVHGTSAVYRAMSLFRQGKAAEARAMLAATEAKMEPLPADEKNPLAGKGTSHDDLILWMARKEARALLADHGDALH